MRPAGTQLRSQSGLKEPRPSHSDYSDCFHLPQISHLTRREKQTSTRPLYPKTPYQDFQNDNSLSASEGRRAERYQNSKAPSSKPSNVAFIFHYCFRYGHLRDPYFYLTASGFQTHFPPVLQAFMKSFIRQCDQQLFLGSRSRLRNSWPRAQAPMNRWFLSFCSPNIDFHKEHWDPFCFSFKEIRCHELSMVL